MHGAGMIFKSLNDSDVLSIDHIVRDLSLSPLEVPLLVVKNSVLDAKPIFIGLPKQLKLPICVVIDLLLKQELTRLGLILFLGASLVLYLLLL